MCESLRAQGLWTVAFDHIPDNHGLPPGVTMVDPASDSITNPGRWITMNLPANAQITPGQGMNTVHVCLIPSGLHRGEVLVLGGNLTNYGVRAYQPWSIVNPWWPAANPNPWPGQTSQYRFHNATIAMPTQGDLFCGGQCWMPDGRLLFAGGTTTYASTTQGWVGARFVYQWDHTPQPGDPFGRWWQMADLEAERWYPTVIYDGTTAFRAIVIGGTNWTLAHGTMEVNSYEVVRPLAYNPTPVLLPTPNDFDRKPPSGPFGTGTTPVGWPASTPLPAPSRRQYWGPHVPAPIDEPAFGDYPRIHALGMLDPISFGGTAPRLFVSGFLSWGVRWAHDIDYDPVFSTAPAPAPAGQGYEIGQYQAVVDTHALYATSLLLPAPAGGISKQVARIGGGRLPSAQASNLVETVQVDSLPSFWKTMPPMNTRRLQGNVVILPTGELFAIGGRTLMNGEFSLIPELFVGGTTWTPMAAHACPRDYHSAAILLPDARVFVCGGENRKNGYPGTDYAIWEPPYFHYSYGSVPPTGITVVNAATSLVVPQDQIVPGMDYGQAYIASWTNHLEPGIVVTSVVLMRPAALTHHDDGGQRMVRLVAWQDEAASSINFISPTSVLHAPPGWWMMFLVTSSGRPSQAYWVHLL